MKKITEIKVCPSDGLKRRGPSGEVKHSDGLAK